MGKYDIDISEVSEILKLIYTPNGEEDNSDYVINKLSEKTGNEFLDGRGNAYADELTSK